MRNIILIGMPAAGKSTLGVILAKRLCMDFIDTDILIQKKFNASLQELICDRGIEGFLDIEGYLCSSLLCKSSVIATGGSVIYREQAMYHLRGLGLIVYLTVPLNEIKKRAGDLLARGVTLGVGQSLDDLYYERTPMYEKWADIVVNEERRTLEQTVDAICCAINVYDL